MAASSAAFAEAIQHSTSLSEAASSSILPSANAMFNSTVAIMEESVRRTSWFGMFGQMTLFLIKALPSLLYWIITFTTITMPTFLFTLFSTSLTFTMNATTLYACFS